MTGLISKDIVWAFQKLSDLLSGSGQDKLEGPFTNFCREHALFPMLCPYLTPEQQSDEVRAYMREAELSAWSNAELRVHQLQGLTSKLRAQGLPYMLLKGPATSLRYYGGLERRFYGDIDILVPPTDFARAAELLEKVGYRQSGRTPLGRRVLLLFEHALEFESPEGRVDLHHNLAVHPSFRLDLNELWGTSQTLCIRSEEHPVLSLTNDLQLLLLGIHRDIGLNTITARPFVDLFMLIDKNRDLDWERFRRQATNQGTWHPVRAVLALFLVLFGLREQLPGLARSVGSLPSPGGAASHFQRGGWARNKLWSWRQLDYPLIGSFAFWLLGLPVRRLAFAK